MLRTFINFCVLFFLINTNYSLAQNEESNNSKVYISKYTTTVKKGEGDYNGSPYANEEFLKGSVFKDGKLIASNLWLRYNAKRDMIEMQRIRNSENKRANILVRDPSISVSILNDTYIYFSGSAENPIKGYFLVLQEGEKLNVYKKVEKKFIEGKKSINTITRNVPASFSEKESYFLLSEKNELQPLPSSRNRRLKLLTQNMKNVKQYIKDYKLNLSREADFLKLLTYYNSI